MTSVPAQYHAQGRVLRRELIAAIEAVWLRESGVPYTLWGVLPTLRMILGYTSFVYRIFSGTATSQSHE